MSLRVILFPNPLVPLTFPLTRLTRRNVRQLESRQNAPSALTLPLVSRGLVVEARMSYYRLYYATPHGIRELLVYQELKTMRWIMNKALCLGQGASGRYLCLGRDSSEYY